nr:hypothetical protein [Deltaproteobacteria bacterium]
PPVEPPPVVSRTISNRPNMFEGSGVSRNQGQGPGLGPILLFIIAALLGTVAVWIWVKKGENRSTVATRQDAGMTVQPLAADAQLAASGDAMPPGDASLVALGDAAPLDARLAEMPLDAPAIDKTKEAKKLMEAAQTAFAAGKYDDAIASIDASLKFRKAVRAHLLKAQALQKLERVNDALDSVDAAVELNATYAPAFELRGKILWAAGRKDEARFAFEQFLALEADGPKAEAIRDLLRENR